MKSTFSAWFGLYVMIGACVALFSFQAFFRHAGVAQFDAAVTEAETTGIVRSVHEASDPLSETYAVVVLASGAEVDGVIAPGCMVLVGDHVKVHVLQALPWMQKSYLVMPAN